MTQPVFDAHLHVIDPAHPLIENSGYLPDPFTVADYRARTEGLGIAGGAVVSGSFQGFDQGYLVDALARARPLVRRGDPDPRRRDRPQVLDLHDAGVRAVRVNVARGGSASLDDLDRLARRVHDLAGWHSELYIDTRAVDDELGERIASLPAVSIDHLGMHADGLPDLLRLVERGVKVKATGFGRVDLDPGTAIRAVLDVDPTALMVGTDLPSTRARRPFQDDDLETIRRALEPDEVSAVFWDNAAAFYLGDPRTV